MKNRIDTLELTAQDIRARIIEHSHLKRMPHLGSCLSSVDILTALYFDVLNIDPESPSDKNRDRFIMSKGHGAPALYQTLAKRGFYTFEQISESDNEAGSLFGEHPPPPGYLPGIEAATGSLGHGLPMAIGMMLSCRLDGQTNKAYVLLGDGECNEGSVWEAAMFAGAQNLGNLVVIIDYNKWQATDRSEDVMALAPLSDKWQAFGWASHEIDGHNMSQITQALRNVPDKTGRPTAIIAHTIKGKGVSFMEDDNNWHYRIPTADEVIAAKKELKVAM